MRRVLHWGAILLTAFLVVVLVGFYALLTGIAFTPFLGLLEQYASQQSHCQISLGKIRLNLKGELVVSAISIKYKELPRVIVPEARIDPRWSAILRRQFILDWARIATGHVELAAPKSEIKLHGQYEGKTGTVEAGVTVFIASLRKEFGTMGGTVTADGNLSGPWRAPQMRVRAHGENLQYKDLAIADAQISWDGDVQHGYLRLEARMKNGASFRGNGPAHRTEDGWTWRWNELLARTPQGHEWAAVPGGSVEVSSAGVVNVRRLRVQDNGGSITVQKLSYQDGLFDVKAVADHFKLDIDTRAAGVIDGMIQLRGPIENPTGTFDLRCSSVSINRLPLVSIRSDGDVKDAKIMIRHGALVGHALPPVAFHGSVPWAWVIRTASKEKMDIAVSAQPLDPSVYLSEIKDIETKPGGTIQIDGRIFGPAGGIQIEGSVSANLPVFQMPAYGIDARDARVDIELKNQHLLIRAAEASLGKGKLSISGESDLPALNYTLHGENITMQARRQFDLKADLTLALTGSTIAPFLTGDIHVVQATYEVNKKKKEDDASEPPPAMLRAWDLLRVEVNANWNNNVWYRDGLTKIETEGKLELFKVHGERELHWRGPVTLLRGSYDAYGRDFIIKSGDVNFTGEVELDPRLNIQATHKMKDAVVDLDVAGTARKPELHFRSTPPMAEQDILSMLALGTAPGKSASGSGADSRTTQATELAADVVSDYITRELRSTGMNVLDLDVIRVAPTDKGKEWTVGRYWGSKLFLSYSYNPDNAASQVLKAEYAVTPKWFLVGQSGSQADNYLDVNFRLPVGKSRKKAPR